MYVFNTKNALIIFVILYAVLAVNAACVGIGRNI